MLDRPKAYDQWLNREKLLWEAKAQTNLLRRIVELLEEPNGRVRDTSEKKTGWLARLVGRK